MATTPQFDFLTQYVLELLKTNGFDNLTEQQKNVYVPALQSRLEERIGLEMLPKLSEAAMSRFAELVQNPGTDAATWKDFWYDSIPNFEDELKLILAGFAEEVKQILTA